MDSQVSLLLCLCGAILCAGQAKVQLCMDAISASCYFNGPALCDWKNDETANVKWTRYKISHWLDGTNYYYNDIKAYYNNLQSKGQATLISHRLCQTYSTTFEMDFVYDLVSFPSKLSVIIETFRGGRWTEERTLWNTTRQTDGLTVGRVHNIQSPTADFRILFKAEKTQRYSLLYISIGSVSLTRSDSQTAPTPSLTNPPKQDSTTLSASPLTSSTTAPSVSSTITGGEQAREADLNCGTLAGIVVGIISVIAIVVVLVVLYRRRRSKGKTGCSLSMCFRNTAAREKPVSQAMENAAYSGDSLQLPVSAAGPRVRGDVRAKVNERQQPDGAQGELSADIYHVPEDTSMDNETSSRPAPDVYAQADKKGKTTPDSESEAGPVYHILEETAAQNDQFAGPGADISGKVDKHTKAPASTDMESGAIYHILEEQGSLSEQPGNSSRVKASQFNEVEYNSLDHSRPEKVPGQAGRVEAEGGEGVYSHLDEEDGQYHQLHFDCTHRAEATGQDDVYSHTGTTA